LVKQTCFRFFSHFFVQFISHTDKYSTNQIVGYSVPILVNWTAV